MEGFDKVEQWTKDLDRIINVIQKIEKTSLEDLEDLKKEIILIKKETENRYGKDNPTKTDTSEA
jgi:hypothetical protein